MTHTASPSRSAGRVFILSLATFLALSAGTAQAMGNVDSWESSGDTDFVAITGMIDQEKYDDAIAGLQKMLEKDPQNADALNYLAYSQRKSGDLANAETNYARALAVNPEHKGALEYQGELFLQTGRENLAQENLARLELICSSSCEEYQELANAIANH
ncbi:tetratricopeptide repeat protein [Thalassospira sp.]|uniref:tetratricopeptide repeat protein n=1 Tax=Thalassospira sp. TaxID=1912094 RepID=UPI00273607E0|nr:tetratricopeptide repeat protein [Thalassospira sp.]MDP2698012.1 tetratricopeptide repeat protein [Thalassospira sp.]